MDGVYHTLTGTGMTKAILHYITHDNSMAIAGKHFLGLMTKFKFFPKFKPIPNLKPLWGEKGSSLE